jgi:large subunit ribosomal protein L30
MPVTKLKVTWKHSAIGKPPTQHQTIRSLGLRRLHQSVTLADTPAVRGAIHKVRHLVDVAVVQD